MVAYHTPPSIHPPIHRPTKLTPQSRPSTPSPNSIPPPTGKPPQSQGAQNIASRHRPGKRFFAAPSTYVHAASSPGYKPAVPPSSSRATPPHPITSHSHRHRHRHPSPSSACTRRPYNSNNKHARSHPIPLPSPHPHSPCPHHPAARHGP